MFFWNKTKLSIKSRGFTLIELIVAISIVVVILSMVMANFKNYEKTIVLNNDLEKLSSIIRQAQIWALTGQRTGVSRPSYGIHLDVCTSPPCAVILFADQNANLEYDTDGSESVNGGDFSLSSYINIGSIKLDDSNVTSLDMIFEPPAATIYFNGSATSHDVAEIQITHQSTGVSSIIKITQSSGQIDIQ